MKRTFLSVFFLMLSLLFLLPSPTTQAQSVTVQIGTNYTIYGINNPFDMYYPDSRTQVIYRLTDINTAFTNAGLTLGPCYIKSISYYAGYWYNYGTPDPNYENVGIKIGTTTEDLLTWQNGPSGFINTSWVDAFTQKAYTFNPTQGSWQKFNFDNIFQYSGAQNIIVDNCHGRSGTYGDKWMTYWDFNEWYHTQWPPKITTLWNYGVGPTFGCSATNGQNGYLYAFPIAQLEVCTGQPSTIDFTVPTYVTLPGTVPVSYTIGHPTLTFNATLTVRFYTPAGALVQTMTVTVPVAANTMSGVINVPTTGMAPGFYRAEVTFNTMNPCGALSDMVMNKSTMVLNADQTPCIVWPGDMNNDGMVNFGDRAKHNKYISDANLRATWLAGPARYRADQNVNPLTYYTWEGQAGVPWQTLDGCHVDANGDGTINNFDLLAVKMNWLKKHGPKAATDADPASFDMSQNYPNPFNPSTSISFRMPENSKVTLVVTDVLGRTVATLVNGQMAAGSHSVKFDASTLNSGVYMATIMATANESGSTFTKSIKMTLNK